MRGKKVAVEIKTRVIEESLKPRCVITNWLRNMGSHLRLYTAGGAVTTEWH